MGKTRANQGKTGQSNNTGQGGELNRVTRQDSAEQGSKRQGGTEEGKEGQGKTEKGATAREGSASKGTEGRGQQTTEGGRTHTH